jgi:hypothetical protein
MIGEVGASENDVISPFFGTFPIGLKLENSLNNKRSDISILQKAINDYNPDQCHADSAYIPANYRLYQRRIDADAAGDASPQGWQSESVS